MAGSTAGDVLVGRGSPATPKRSTRLVKPSAKAKESGIDDASPVKGVKAPTTRATRATRAARELSNDTDTEHVETLGNSHDRAELAETLLYKVLDELKDIKIASAKQQELIEKLQDQADEASREVRDTKEELKYVREQLEAVTTAITVPETSPRPSYAEIARTPPESQPTNLRSLTSPNKTPSEVTDLLYCTVDVSRVDEGAINQSPAGTIRETIETRLRSELDQANWRCRAVTVDRKNPNRIRIASRNEAEHKLVKQVAEAHAPRGARVLRDELYPVKVDNASRVAVLDEQGDYQPGVTEALSKANDVQVAKVAWLSKRDTPKAYGSMVVYLTKAADARRVLQDRFFYVGDESGSTERFERRFRPEQCYNCQEIGHKAFQCNKTQKCGKCAKEGHHHSVCTELTPKCVPCGGPHESFSKNCRKLFPIRHE